jgi:Na+-driven multidrug efflux pump
MAPTAMKIIFSFFPLVIIHVITEGYFQAIGRPAISFYLILLKNVVLLIPLIYILSYFFGYHGILYTFPVVDVLTTIASIWLLKTQPELRLQQKALPIN